MSFGFVPALLGVLGLGAIAGLLYALQRLRVRHQEVEVETTLFWRQAIEESRARVLTQRFRHPWTYALLLSICSLLWLAFAGLRSDAADERDHVVLIDGSAGMAHGARFEAAVDAAADYVVGLPAAARRVVLCAGRAKTVLRPDEEALLLRRRLADVAPADAPNRVVDVLFDLLRARPARPTTVCVVGDLPLRADERAQLPASVEVRRLPVPARAGGNFGVTSLGVRPAASGRGDAVDVLVEVRGAGVRILLGVDRSGGLLGVRVLEHRETPGLGDGIEEAKSDWITRFTGLRIGEPPEQDWQVVKDGGIFDQFTGATITPRAVVRGVHEGLLIHQQWMQSQPTSTTAEESQP